MSSTVYANVPCEFDTDEATLVNANGTNAVILMEPPQAAVRVTTAPPSPLFYGGSSVIDGSVMSTDSVDRDLALWKCKILTDGAQTTNPTGALATGSSSTITRATGSFITDLWKVGDRIMVFAPRNQTPNAAVDGIVATITAVAALTLTVSGTPFAVLALVTGTRITRVRQIMTTSVPLGSGTTNAKPTVKLVNNPQDASISVGDRKLGRKDMLAISVLVAVTASTVVTAGVEYARY